MRAQILIIDDDEKMCQLVKKGLEADAYMVDIAHDGVSGLEKISNTKYDLVILDIMMPHLNGFKTLNYIREISSLPVIMLTARGEEIDELMGLNMGADDYLHKPCSLAVLKARVKNILKRTLSKQEKVKVLKFGNIEINFASKKVFKNNQQVDLTKSQFIILCYLASNKNKVCTKEELCKEALGNPYIKNQRSIDTHINNIRDKLLTDDINSSLSIKNIYGVGYELKCE